MRGRKVRVLIVLFGLIAGRTVAAQGIDIEPISYRPATTTHPGNAGAWPLLVGSTAVGVWNLIQAPMGKSRMWSVTGIGLGLAATGYGKVTLDNGTSTSDLAMGTMTVGILTTAASTIALLPREGAAPQSQLSGVQQGTLFGLTTLSSMISLLDFAKNLEGDDQGLSSATIGVGLGAAVFGVGAAAQVPQNRLLARSAIIAGTFATVTGIATFARHPKPRYPSGYDCPGTGSTCRPLARVTIGRIAF
jgi:hypothetical protein